MGKGGKGGGSAQFPKVDTNPPIDTRTQTGFQTVESATGDLSGYLNSIINPSLSLGNWAAEQATGGFAGGIEGINPNVNFGIGANTETGFYFPDVGNLPSSGALGAPPLSAEFPAPGYGGPSDFGAPMAPGSSNPGGGSGGGGGGDMVLAPGISATATGPPVSFWQPGGQQQQYVPVGNGYYQLPGQTGAGFPYYQPYSSGSGWQGVTQVQAPMQNAPGSTGGGGGGAGGTGTRVDDRGPLLSGAENALLSEIGIAQQQPPGVDPATIKSLEDQFFHNANPANIPGGTLPESGLYPDQQSLIDTQVKSAQAATEQQLADEGLNSSTMGTELAGEIGLQGAAEAGTLIQGNIQLAQSAQQVAQNWAKLGMGEQTLGMAEQQQMFDFFSQISKQYGGLQAQMWSEAIQGYGVFSGIINQLLESYGLSTQQNQAVIQGEAAQAQAQAGIEEASIQSQASQSSSMMSSIGSIVGAIASIFL